MNLKKIAITGSTGGLGVKICDMLAERGFDIVLVDRNQTKSEENAKRLKEKNPEISVELIKCDLEDMESVKRAKDELINKEIDCLILNSGIYNVPLKTCDTGYNNVFQVNFIAQYYLARSISESSSTLKKVIAMSSIAHDFTKIDETDIDFSTRKKSSKIYGNSKRFMTFALYEYFKNDKNVALSIVHPGVTLTNITNHYPKAINWLIKIGIKLVFPSPKKAARPVGVALNEDCGYLEWIGPSVFNIWGKPKKSVLKTCGEKERETIGRIADEIYSAI